MNKYIIMLVLAVAQNACSKKQRNTEKAVFEIEGTWKMIYGEVRDNNSVEIKDLTNTEFVKIINHSHFAFFNQVYDEDSSFYAGAGTYSL